MRGKASPKSGMYSFRRITPAHAGKSHVCAVLADGGEDHPRPCGEKSPVDMAGGFFVGSPPPMRGKVFQPSRQTQKFGITPAHAGKSCPVRSTYPARRDHPRPCGEKAAIRSTRWLCWGSPPPMRGKGRHPLHKVVVLGITPAHAGKSIARNRCPVCSWDHPRPCGEKSYADNVEIHHAGSPPPMRGKVRYWRLSRMGVRITPAHAGKS